MLNIIMNKLFFFVVFFYNVILDMVNVYYSGERLELICWMIIDFEYGDVVLEVWFLNGLVFREFVLRIKYVLIRNSGCFVNFEWKFKSGIFLELFLNGLIVWCIVFNRFLNIFVFML